MLAALVLGGVGLPLPEDLALFTAGYLVWRGEASPAFFAPACVLAIVASDSLLFFFGRRFARRLLLRPLTARPLARLIAAYERHGVRFLLIGRLAVGARTPFFVAAGLAGMRFVRFAIWDLLGTSVMVCLWFALGIRFGAQLERVHWLLCGLELILPAALIGWGAWKLYRLVRARREAFPKLLPAACKPEAAANPDSSILGP